MKKLLKLTGLLVFALISQLGMSQQIDYNDSWGDHGFMLQNEDNTNVIINFSLKSFTLSDLDLDGEQLKTIGVPGIFLPNDEGAPDLAGTGRFIAIPQGAIASLKVTASRTETLKNVSIAPAPRIPLDTDKSPLKYEKNQKIYSKNAFYPEEPVKLSAPTKLRGVDVVMLGVTPFQYNPVTKELIVYRDLKIEVTYQGGNGHVGEDRLRSRWWDPIVYDAVLNPNAIPEIDYSKKKSIKDTPDYEYIIITPNDPVFLAWADTIKVWRTLQGIRTGVVTTTEIGGNTTTSIKNYINNAYNNWDFPPAAVLLLADYNTGTAGITSYLYSHPAGYPNYASDNYFADVTGDDLPEVVFARITGNNNTQFQIMVSKFMNNERNPPTDPLFYNKPITALGWQTVRWFQICSEVVGGFWKNVQGKNPVRVNAVYEGNPTTDAWSTATNTSQVLAYFGPAGLGYIPATPQELGGFSGGTAQGVINAINTGSFMLQHRDHGSYDGWGEPAFNSTSISSLTNVNNKLPFIFSINCQTGAFHNTSECFAEKFHRWTYGGQNSGALGLIAATEVSYSFVNDTYVWGLFDNLWTNFMPGYGTNPASRDVLPAFGNAAGKYFLYQSGWPYNTGDKQVTYRLFHHHGDAFMTVYTEVPQNLTVNHAAALLSGTTSFSVTANAGSFIALTVNGEIIGTANGTGSPVSVAITPQNPGQDLVITVTKQNFYRYSSTIPIVPPTGPYVAYETHVINDASGNNNGAADYGENITLHMTLENLGSAAANSVTATLASSDSYITITDNSASYGTINAGTTSTVNNAFAITIASNVPDQHIVNFELSVSGIADETWISNFTINLNAPEFTTGSLTVNDVSGGNGNGKLDPGETASIIIQTTNSGHSNSPPALATLSSPSPYITINSGTQNFTTILTGTTVSPAFDITVSPSTPAGTNVTLNYNIVAGSYFANSSYNAVAGQIPVLILNLDPNNSSAPAMQTALTELNIPYSISTSFPPNLNLYRTVFVCLGIYSSNHVLNTTEGTTLANFLNNGGNIYMEGGDTWAYDSQTAVHSMFNIDGISDGSADMSTIAGKAGTFTQGMSFAYSGENSWMDRISQISPAFLILQNQSPVYGTGVAFDAGTYKTIGCSHEFGGLVNGSLPSTKTELMFQYLDFFGLIPPPAITVNLKIYLEGPFAGSDMTTNLLNLPIYQPYNMAPWNYSGSESVAVVPANVVDWVLVELRDASSAAAATAATRIARQAGFLMSDGSIVSTNGSSPLFFSVSITNNLFAVVHHRNHLGILSANALTPSGGNYNYDFTTGFDKTYGETFGCKEVAPGIWGMIGGDANCDDEITVLDINVLWKPNAGEAGYRLEDLNLDGQVNNQDKDDCWQPNIGSGCQVPE